MITFYKLYDIENDINVNINPKNIELYIEKPKYFHVSLVSGTYINVDKFAFENMLIEEGIDKYWQQQITLTEYLLITKIKLFYYQSL